MNQDDQDPNPLDFVPAPHENEVDRTEAHAPSSSAQDESESSPILGNYKLLQKIGEGGQGAVWMADQIRPIERRVAIKLLKPGQADKQTLARFDAELRALERMNHRCIAKVLDAGATKDNRPFIVMELVKGKPITHYCDENKLSITERLNLFTMVCRAIEHAHQKGVIHRDLKPGNVLVTQYDGEPVPKVIDFGLAKAIEQFPKLTDKTMFTKFGMVMGTLQYMSPEQLETNALDIDTRSDIYSLGVILYELLTGTTPTDKHGLQGKAIDEVLRSIREDDPPAPSIRISASTKIRDGVSLQRQVDPRKLGLLVKGDLDLITMKALDKVRSRRYATADAFARDVSNYLADEPISARPDSTLYRLRKSMKKHRLAYAAGAAMLICLLLGLAATSWQAFRATTAEGNAEKARQHAVRESERAENLRKLEAKSRQQAESNATLAEAESRKAKSKESEAIEQRTRAQELAVHNVVLHGLQLLERGDRLGALPWFAKALDLDQHSKARERVHRVRVGAVLSRNLKTSMEVALDEPIVDACFANFGRHLVSISESGEVSSHHAFQQGNRLYAKQLFDGPARIQSIDNNKYCFAWNSRQAFSWDSSALPPAFIALEIPGGIQQFFCDPRHDAAYVLTSQGRILRIKPAEQSTDEVVDAGDKLRRFCVSEDETLCAGIDSIGQTRLWRLETGDQFAKLKSPFVDGDLVTIAPNAMTVAVGSPRHGVVCWDLAEGKTRLSLLQQGHLSSLCFSPDSKMLLISDSSQGEVRAWRMGSSTLESTLRHTTPVLQTEMSPDSKWLLTTSGGRVANGEIRLWRTVRDPSSDYIKRFYEDAEQARFSQRISRATFSANGRFFLAASLDGTMRVWHVPMGELNKSMPADTKISTVSIYRPRRESIPQFDSPIDNASNHFDEEIDDDNSQIVIGTEDGAVEIYDAWVVRSRMTLSHRLAMLKQRHGEDEQTLTKASDFTPRGVTAALFSPDGQFVTTAGKEGGLRFWVPQGHEPDPTGFELQGVAQDIDISRSSSLVAVGYGDHELGTGGVRLFRVAYRKAPTPGQPRLDVQALGPPANNDGIVVKVAINHLESLVASLTQQGKISLRKVDAKGISPLDLDLPHSAAVNDFMFSPTQPLLATACADRLARIWSLEGEKPKLIAEMRHADSVEQIHFTQTGDALATSSAAWTVRLWNVKGESIMPPIHHHRRITSLAISNDGWLLATGDDSGAAIVWDTATGLQVSLKMKHNTPVREVMFTPNNRTVATLTDGRRLRLWDIPPSKSDSQQLIRAATLLAGQTVKGAGLVPLGQAERKKLHLEIQKHKDDSDRYFGSQNPFGVADVAFDLDNDEELNEVRDIIRPVPPKANLNSIPWANIEPAEHNIGIEGLWASRWNQADVSPSSRWQTGTAEVILNGDKLYILYDDGGIYLIEARRVAADRFEGRYINLYHRYQSSRENPDGTPWIGIVVNNNRIDGYWRNGRWDLRRNTAEDAADWDQVREDIKAKKTAAAIRGMDKLIESHPDQVAYRYIRGVALADLGQFRKAALDFQAYIDVDPNFNSRLLPLAQLYAHLGDLEAYRKVAHRLVTSVDPRIPLSTRYAFARELLVATPSEQDLNVLDQWRLQIQDAKNFTDGVSADLQARIELRRGNLAMAEKAFQRLWKTSRGATPPFSAHLYRAILYKRLDKKNEFADLEKAIHEKWKIRAKSTLQWQNRVAYAMLAKEAGIKLNPSPLLPSTASTPVASARRVTTVSN